MNVSLYNNNSDKNKLNKNLYKMKSDFPCICKDDTDFMNPVLIFNSTPEVQDFNYIWIPEPFNRYYFVTNKTVSQGKMIITCHVDVLMSFRHDIENLEVIAERASSNYNLMQIDGKLPIENFNDVATKKFPNAFGGENFILATTGKVN